MPLPEPTDLPICRILVVDDEPGVCESLKMLLDFDGHTIETAANGQQALALYQKDKFDVVITDYEMPMMKGTELAEQIKKINPKQPVVMITAYAEMLSASGKPLTGVDHLVSKPFLLENLRDAIRKVAAQSKPRKNAAAKKKS
jgi:CheY-like chemotaxis protein